MIKKGGIVPAKYLIIAVLSACVTLSNKCLAEPTTDTGDEIRPLDKMSITSMRVPVIKETTPSGADGWITGSFSIKPEVILTQLYDDNIFATSSNEVNDNVTILSPSISLKSQWQKHKLNLGAGLDTARYATNSSENYNNYYLTADGQYFLSSTENIFGGIEFNSSHEERSSLDDINGIEPTPYNETSAHFGYYKKLDKYKVRLGGTIDEFDFDNVSNLGGFTNDDRDRTEYSVGTRLSYKLNPKYEPYLQAVYVDRSYDLALDDNLFNRDSTGYRAGLGVITRFDRKTAAEFYLGYLNQEYEDSALKDVSTVDIGINVQKQYNTNTDVTLSIDRSLEETTINGASSYLYTIASARIKHRLNSNYNVNFDLSYSENEYQGINRTEHEMLTSIGLRYKLNPNLFLSAAYRFLNRNSDINSADYYRNQVILSIGGLLYPIRNSSQPRRKDKSDQPSYNHPVFSNFYAGLNIGYGLLGTASEGPRGGGGSDYGEFGGDGSTTGLFAGYRRYFNPWFLGLEIEVEDSKAAWRHSKNKSDSRTFNVEKDSGYGVSAIGGFTLPHGKLLYARYGQVKTDFNTYYTLNSMPSDAFDQSVTLTGTRYGIGAEIAEMKHLFWRMEYTFTNYDNYRVDYVTNVENFENTESLFRIGLGWHIGGHPNKYRKPSTMNYNGFYAGLNIGHSSLSTDMTGQHRSGGSGPFDFDADFGEYGSTSGFFTGYGFVTKNVYLGLELGAVSSHAGWRHDRETAGGGGRDFSVDMKGSYGGNIRIGYILPSQSLIYILAGRMRSKFNTRYIKGNNSSTWIDHVDKLWGDRYGLGMEIPVYKQTFVRLDYSLTDYSDYELTTTHVTNPDTNRFNNRDSLFMLGIGIRF